MKKEKLSNEYILTSLSKGLRDVHSSLGFSTVKEFVQFTSSNTSISPATIERIYYQNSSIPNNETVSRVTDFIVRFKELDIKGQLPKHVQEYVRENIVLLDNSPENRIAIDYLLNDKLAITFALQAAGGIKLKYIQEMYGNLGMRVVEKLKHYKVVYFDDEIIHLEKKFSLAFVNVGHLRKKALSVLTSYDFCETNEKINENYFEDLLLISASKEASDEILKEIHRTRIRIQHILKEDKASEKKVMYVGLIGKK